MYELKVIFPVDVKHMQLYSSSNILRGLRSEFPMAHPQVLRELEPIP